MSTLMRNKGAAGLILVLIIALVLSPMVSFGFDNETYDAYVDTGKYTDVDPVTGEKENYGYEETEQIITTPSGAGSDIYVKYGKSITRSGVEPNLFNITLDVETNENIKDIYIPSNVMIVLDVSNSMDTSLVDTNNNGTGDTSRWIIFRNAMQKFVNDFLTEDPNGQNSVSIAIFGGSSANNTSSTVHKTIQTWTSSTKSAIASFNEDRAADLRVTHFGDNGTTNSDSKNGTTHLYGFTNGEAMFKAAVDGIKPTTKDYKDQYTSVVVVSDGEFNRSYSSTDTKAATANSCAITESNNLSSVDLYTVGIGSKSEQSAMRDKFQSNGNSNVDKAFNANDNDISLILNKVFAQIQGSVQCWTVTDPMSNWVNYGQVVKATPTASAVGSTIIEYSTDKKELTWDLKRDEPVNSYTDRTKNYIVYQYSMTYSVSLDLDAVDAAKDDEGRWNEFLPTNKETLLSYAFIIDSVLQPTEEAAFRVPTLKGTKSLKPGNITISKAVSENASDNNDTFSFKVYRGANTEELYSGPYTINDQAQPNMVNGELKLKAGDVAKITGLVAGSSITVQEVPHTYYKVEGSEIKTETVVAGESVNIAFKNNYEKSTSISAIKSSDPKSGSVRENGQEIKYTIDVTNNDSVTATGIVVKDFIPNHTEFVSAENDGIYSSSDNSVKWYLGDLSPKGSEGATKSVSFTVKVIENYDDEIRNVGLFKQTGEATSEGAFNNNDEFKETNPVVHFPPAPEMEITKINNPTKDTAVSAGDPIEYTMTIKNTGKVTLKNVWVKDFIPGNTTYKAGSVSNVDDYNGIFDSAGNFVEWVIPSIAVGQETTVSFTVNVNAVYPADTIIKNIALGEVLGNDNERGSENPSKETNEVENPTTTVLPAYTEETPTAVAGEEAQDPNVLGEDAAPVDEDEPEQQVLGEEAKTGDATTAMPYLLIMLVAAGGAMFLAMRRMTKKD